METFVVGELEFIGEPSKDELSLIQSELEVHPENNNYWEANKLHIEKNTNGNTTVHILSVNWTSHIDNEGIKQMLKTLEKRLVRYSLSLFYLNEPYANFYKEDEKRRRGKQ